MTKTEPIKESPPKEPKKATPKPEATFNLKKENRYVVAGFKSSKNYNKDLKGKKLEEAYNKYKKQGVEIK